MKTAVGLVVSIAMVGSAAAQPGATAPTPPAAERTPPVQPSSSAPSIPMMPRELPAEPSHAPGERSHAQALPTIPGEVSEEKALTIALGTTIASWSVLAVGIGTENGPIAGMGLLGTLILPSAGNWYAGATGGLGLGMRAAGAAAEFWVLRRVLACHDECSSTALEGGVGLLGLGLYAAGTIVDLATAPSAAREHNRALRPLTVAPAVHPGGAGLVIGGRF